MLMAPTALWTAAHHDLPALIVVANNQSYYNDEEHQERVARTRGRPPENRWVGQRMAEPAVDFASLARSLGVEGFGPVAQPDQVAAAMSGAVAAVREGRPALVDVRVAPR
jgi:thiamine pyrophosphate-dependent acetolactate synthase large subunit-like protein